MLAVALVLPNLMGEIVLSPDRHLPGAITIETGARAAGFACDLRDGASITALVDAVIAAFEPELARAPNEHVHAPRHMGPLEQQAAGCVPGRDYPAPVVRHEEARERTLARYGAVRAP